MGGGIHNESGGNVLVENSTIAHNASADGGGIFNYGSLVVRNSAIIFNSTDFPARRGHSQRRGSVEIVNSTIAKNIAGGALRRRWRVLNALAAWFPSPTARFGRIKRSSAPAEGGGILNTGGTLRVQNTIVAGNTSIEPICGGPDCSGTITSLGNNLVGDPSGCAINLQPSDLTGDPGLGSLVGTGEDDLPGRPFIQSWPGVR